MPLPQTLEPRRRIKMGQAGRHSSVSDPRAQREVIEPRAVNSVPESVAQTPSRSRKRARSQSRRLGTAVAPSKCFPSGLLSSQHLPKVEGSSGHRQWSGGPEKWGHTPSQTQRPAPRAGEVLQREMLLSETGGDALSYTDSRRLFPDYDKGPERTCWKHSSQTNLHLTT